MTREEAKEISIVKEIDIGYTNISLLDRQKKNKLIDDIYDDFDAQLALNELGCISLPPMFRKENNESK